VSFVQIVRWYEAYTNSRDVHEQSGKIKRFVSVLAQFLDKVSRMTRTARTKKRLGRAARLIRPAAALSSHHSPCHARGRRRGQRASGPAQAASSIFMEAALADWIVIPIDLTLSVCIACACVSTSLAPVPVPVPVCLLCIRNLPSLCFSPAWSFGRGPSFQLQTVVYSHLLTIVAPRSLAPHEHPSSKQSQLFRSDPQALVRHLSRRANEINNQLYEFVHMPMHAPGWENKIKHIREVGQAAHAMVQRSGRACAQP